MITTTQPRLETGLKPPPISDEAFEALARRMRAETGIIMTEAKKGLAVSRLSRRLRTLNLSDFEGYCSLLDGPDGASEMQEMILLLTTNVTRFFREPHHFDDLRRKILPALIAKAKAGGRVRLWSAGCSSGEEPYSIAMTILDEFPEAPSHDLRILATDIDRNVVEKGQRGRYALTDEDRDAFPTLSKHLQPVAGEAGSFDVAASLRSLVQFAELNLQHPWPMAGAFDVIFCRNVVIYFDDETQKILWPRFAATLVDGGHLMIGHSERVSGPALNRLKPCGATQYRLQS